MPKEIRLTKGAVTIVDDSDYEFLNQWKWHITRKGYAAREGYYREDTKKYKYFTISMHRVILFATDGVQVDHKDGNKLNNQKENLRYCTNGQNQANGGSYKNSSSKYRGVSWNTKRCGWVAQIQSNKIKRILGIYNDEIEAAKIYNKAALELFGEFARINEIPEEHHP